MSNNITGNYPYGMYDPATQTYRNMRGDTWATLTITYKDKDRAPLNRNLRASPGLLKHLLSEGRETGWLYIFDERSSEAIPFDADTIETITMTQITENK